MKTRLESINVLILISVEDTFRDAKMFYKIGLNGCLNPYFSGRYVPRVLIDRLTTQTEWCLNPYFSGRYVPSGMKREIKFRGKVLILISVEDTFRVK